MRYNLIDRIVQVDVGKSLQAQKYLSLSEEYLADHFPRFPIMPGVLMLQALVEAASWLWRSTSQFQHSIIVLREVRTVKYGHFMQPGRRLDVMVTLKNQKGSTATFAGKGLNDQGEQTVSAQFDLFGYCLADRGSPGVETDAKLIAYWKDRWNLLTGQLWASATAGETAT